MNILICSAGKRVSLVRSFQKELRDVFPEAKIFTSDINPDYAPACQVSDGFFKVNPVISINYISNLLKICQSENIKLIVPTIDTELQILADNKAMFLDHNIQIVVSSSDFVRKCRDKRLTNEFFVCNGINVPKSIDKNNPIFPLFIKPYDGSLSKDIFLIRNKLELSDFHLNNEKLMFMEYIDPLQNQEFTVDMYYGRDHKVKCIIPRKRIEIRAGEISKGLTVKNKIIDFLREKLGHIEGSVGCLTLQLFFNLKTENIIGIEINPRFGGGFPLAYHAGGNFPGWLIDEYLLEKRIGYMDTWEENLLMLRYDDEIIVHGVNN